MSTGLKNGVSSETAFSERLAYVADATEALLTKLIAQTPVEGERTRPERLVAAMRHAALGGGKRLRPFLIAETAALFDVPEARALMTGAALECLHCYSLVHDDLPVMDNDDLRRGKPTVHKAYDDATAILAGDALLTIAFDILSRTETHPDASVRVALVSALARAAGVGGMAGGQMLDLAAEGRFGTKAALDQNGVTTLQAMKTGALIRFACNAGAILGGAAPRKRETLDNYGRVLGEAFQIADDLLDAEGDAASVGKRTGKDDAAGKATLVSILGRDGARTRLAALVEEASRALEPFGPHGDILRATARFVADRKI